MGPERTCVGCRTKRSTADLVRIIAGPPGALEVSAASLGRGAWLCRDSPRCLDLAIVARAFQRAFRREVGVDALVTLRSRLFGEAEGGEGVGE